MFDCFNDVGACEAFVSIRAMTFEEGLVESGSVEAQARYGGRVVKYKGRVFSGQHG